MRGATIRELRELPREWWVFRLCGKVITKEESRELREKETPPEGYEWREHPVRSSPQKLLIKIVREKG